MKRACLANETVRGCATYSNILSVDPIVTSAVEIVDVKINDVSDYSYSDFPIIVRSETDAALAISDLNSIKDYYSLVIGDDLTIETTHSKNPLETDACQALADDSFVSVNELTAECEVQTYKVPITHLD
jgi:fructose 1,6-bisphosphatase